MSSIASERTMTSSVRTSTSSRSDTRIQGFFRMLRRTVDRALQQLHKNASSDTDEVEQLRKLEAGLQILAEWDRSDVIDSEMNSVVHMYPDVQTAYQEAGLAYAQQMQTYRGRDRDRRLRVTLLPLRDFLGQMYKFVASEPAVLNGSYFDGRMRYRDQTALLQMAFDDTLRRAVTIRRRSNAPKSRLRSSVAAESVAAAASRGGGSGRSSIATRRSSSTAADSRATMSRAQHVVRRYETDERQSLAPDDSVSSFPQEQRGAEIDKRSAVIAAPSVVDKSQITEMRLQEHRDEQQLSTHDDDGDVLQVRMPVATDQVSSAGLSSEVMALPRRSDGAPPAYWSDGASNVTALINH